MASFNPLICDSDTLYHIHHKNHSSDNLQIHNSDKRIITAQQKITTALEINIMYVSKSQDGSNKNNHVTIKYMEVSRKNKHFGTKNDYVCIKSNCVTAKNHNVS